jgi:hypothetical protein
MQLIQLSLSVCALVIAGAESSLAGAEQQWNDAMNVLDDKLQASPSPLDSCIVFPLDTWLFLHLQFLCIPVYCIDCSIAEVLAMLYLCASDA